MSYRSKKLLESGSSEDGTCPSSSNAAAAVHNGMREQETSEALTGTAVRISNTAALKKRLDLHVDSYSHIVGYRTFGRQFLVAKSDSSHCPKSPTALAEE